MQTSLVLDWADGQYSFKLTWVGASEIERKAGAGIQVIYERLLLGNSHQIDVSETIRQALLGGTGGTVDGQAIELNDATINALIERYVTGPEMNPFVQSWKLAQAIMHTFMVGHEDAQKKSDGELTSEDETAE